ncbi:FAD:protein FMN transferase [Sinirhodobacter sp. WL0062]|uniref:FAD:protein FMN transferase n=1 Tax=Rhodobacter flavimaris TaxID=2907145 RepID=A0ABS8YW77_9RHOB|nr:FAD:protein FMN transferase [Sinirhodobacter sp. WL0062]MCE5973763.1 FAD:protein FMN transferase [Sinirhodobacter sp. WL0062]
MSKTPTEPQRIALNGPTMGARWSVLFYAPSGYDPGVLAIALQDAVAEVDNQMSTWKPDSALMRFNAAPVGDWVALPAHLLRVLGLGLRIGRASGGAFDIGMGDAVQAWGFGPEAANGEAIRAALTRARRPAHELLDLAPERGEARKRAPLALDLNGIAKGYGVDRLAEVMLEHGITSALVGIDGEMRALGLRPDGAPWSVAVEAPDPARRAPHSILTLEDAAVATSGDYRHWVDLGSQRLSHTMQPRRGAPVQGGPASVSVVARSCAEADAWATVLMVLGPEEGARLARREGLDALFLLRTPEITAIPVGRLFGGVEA